MPLPSSALVLNVAFAGHRAAADSEAAAAAMADAVAGAFDLVAEATRIMAAMPATHGGGETIADAHGGLGGRTETAPALRLLSGYAPGTDRIAVETWRARGLGPVHLVFPFIAPGTASGAERPEAAFTDNPEQPEPGADVRMADANLQPQDVVSVLDGAASEAEKPRRAAHLDQSRFLVRWADVLVALWNGEPAQGAGGTADAVRLALAKGVPVVWIDPRAWTIRFINPQGLWADASPAEILDLLAHAAELDTYMPPANAAALAAVLGPLFAPPADAAGHHGHADPSHDEASETDSRKDYALDPLKPGGRRDRAAIWLARWLAGLWGPMVNLVSGMGPAPRAADPERSAITRQQAGFRLLADEAQAASELADYTGNLQRVVQLLLLLLAVVAVAVATAPVIWTHQKVYFVGVELIILGIVFVVWRLRGIAVNHRRWSDSRRLAERLRAALATWPLAVDAADGQAEPAGTWTEWRARGILRIAGPPTGTLDRERLLADARYGRDHSHSIVQGQIDYHARIGERNGRISHRLEGIEESAFVLLVGLIIAFIVFLAASELLHIDHAYVSLAGRVLLFCSAVLPIVAAACLAIEAKVGFHETALRSQRLKPAFEQIRHAMADDVLSPAQAQESLREAARLLTADADSWRDGVSRRRLAKL